MIDRDLINKLESEARLTVAEQIALDEQLGLPSQSQAQNWVCDLSEEIPSMAWRSQLNERLSSARPSGNGRKPAIAWLCASALGIAGAASLALLIAQPYTEGAPPVPATLEAALIAAHIDAVGALDSGLSFTERPSTSTADASGVKWSEADIEAL